MGDKSTIQWTDATWNPVTGCSKVSPGCKNCYAERIFPRAYPQFCGCGHKELDHNHGESEFDGLEDCQLCKCQGFRQRKFTDVVCHLDRLRQPLHWKKPRKIFVNSMSDLFHEDVPFKFIHDVWVTMFGAPQHTFQILTKRADRMLDFTNNYMGKVLATLPNVWLGVSVEDQKRANERIPKLLHSPAAKHFVSYEPALEYVDFSAVKVGCAWNAMYCACSVENCGHPKLDWIIVGGESGPQARPFNLDWARQTINQCKPAHVACFVKQMGARPFLKMPRSIPVDQPGMNFNPNIKLPSDQLEIDQTISYKDSHGGNWDEWPTDLRVREFPR